ncbi:MAG: VCBS repeat-containing protein [Proteobacteria bacterium]|nr:VCBS repeat-containing protein [Pseudomonadota bacterium]
MKRSFYFISVLACCSLLAAGCSDDSNSGSVPGNQEGKSCHCSTGKICNDAGECVDDPDYQKPGSKDSCDNKCKPNQECKDGKCVDSGEPIPDACKPGCAEDQVCTDTGCVNSSEICDPPCEGDRVCVQNQCEFTCAVHCNEQCCEDDGVCDAITGQCGQTCDDGMPECNGVCCGSDAECVAELGCVKTCQSDELQCINYTSGYSFCCPSGQLCDLTIDQCTIDCGANVKCADVCCKENEVCLHDSVCKPSCKDSETRCGANEDLCCDTASQICIFNKCLAKGKECKDSNQCGLDEFCDTASSTCVKASESPNVCEYHPPIGEFKPKVKWHYGEAAVENTPAVADLTGDGVPEVVFTNMSFQLLALNGDTGAIMAKSTARQWNDYDGMALGDIDNDGKIEVIATTAESNANSSGLAILNLVKNGDAWEWKEKAFLPIADDKLVSASSRYWVDIHPAIADIDSDGTPEIVTTRGIIKGNDLSKWQCTMYFPSYGAWYQYGLVVADLDGDGNSEIIGHKMYDNHCNLIMDESEESWGFTAVADLIKDGGEAGELVPEIVRVKSINAGTGAVSAWKVFKNGDKWTQKKMWETVHPGGGGGHPNIADFDGDKKAEIGLAGGSKYAVFKGDTGAVLWDTPTNDSSSFRTGSSVFDFEGDGKAEVVYRDQCYIRIYNGADGKELWREPATSGTVLDYPLIVDVDGDGKTEIITTSSGYNCGDFASTPLGVVAYEDSWGNWVRTRQIWNQHTYHVTNINDDGSVPKNEKPNWTIYNNYRQNVQPEGAFNAPNFVAGKLDSEAIGCEQGKEIIKLVAHVKNEGSYGVKAGLPVNFYVVDPNGITGEFKIGSGKTEGPLPPSGETTATFEWNRMVDINGESKKVDMPAKILFFVDEPTAETPNGVYPECNEKDNKSEITSVNGCGVN